MTDRTDKVGVETLTSDRLNRIARDGGIRRRDVLRTVALAPVLLAQGQRAFAAQYDLLIKGGRVLDAAQRMDRVADVAIHDGRIAAIRTNIPASSAAEVIDASGLLVSPGLIDIHTHLADPAMPPAVLLQDGVTCLVDAGSRGSDNPDDLIEIARHAPNRVRILLNIGHLGVLPEGELNNIEDAHADATRRVIEQNRQWMVGVKARLSRQVAGEHDLEAVRRAVQAAAPLKVPIMLHVGDTFSPLPDILALLRPGDIVTHVYAPAPHGILDENGKVMPQIREARKRGILFDFGNGRTQHFTWDVVERALQQDFLPDTISTDSTLAGRTSQVFNLPHVMSKFLLFGMAEDQLFARVTANAARAIPEFKTYGSLRPGAPADVAVLEMKQGDFEFVDNYGGKRRGHQQLVTTAVIKDGKRVAKA